MQAVRSYERGLLRGIARYARLHGPWQFYRQLPQISGGTTISPAEIRQWQPDGIIIREEYWHKMRLPDGIPCIYAPATKILPGHPNIITNDLKVGTMAATHLTERGFKHLAYCGMDRRYFWSRLRRDGFVSELAKTNITPHIYQRASTGSIHWNRDLTAISLWLKTLPTPLGLFVCNDDFTLLAAEACKTANLQVPEDVAILGVGNDEDICELAPVSISSIRIGTEQAGYRAAEILDQAMRSNPPPDNLPATIVAEPIDIVTRRSTDIFALDDRHIASALRYIRDHAARPIQVSDVLHNLPLSRRTLYSRFKSATGTSLYEYIRRTRLEYFTSLLLETNLSISEIASSMQFSSEKNISRYFRSEKGITPLAYRRQHTTVTPNS
jgi:LacI family transcriptional regulator